VVRVWRELYSEELHNLYLSQNMTWVIKSRKMRQAGHVARMKEMRNSFKMLVGKAERRDPLEDLVIDWKIILE